MFYKGKWLNIRMNVYASPLLRHNFGIDVAVLKGNCFRYPGLLKISYFLSWKIQDNCGNCENKMLAG